MNRLISRLILVPAILIVILLHSYATTPKETMEAGINKLFKTQGDPAFKAKPENERIAIIGAEKEYTHEHNP